ncbi:uncharacterized protein V6R79_007559 [Siganus canaliculatus]
MSRSRFKSLSGTVQGGGEAGHACFRTGGVVAGCCDAVWRSRGLGVEGTDGCVTLANCSNCQTVREERPARTHWIHSRFEEGKGKWRKGVGGHDRGRGGGNKKRHQQGVGWMRGDREQESASRSIKGPIKRSGVCAKSASGM